MSRTSVKPKYQVQKQMQDFTSKIRYVAEQTVCEEHEAMKGRPCWWIPGDGSILYAGVCNSRASKIFTGTPSESSIRRNFKKENR